MAATTPNDSQAYASLWPLDAETARLLIDATRRRLPIALVATTPAVLWRQASALHRLSGRSRLVFWSAAEGASPPAPLPGESPGETTLVADGLEGVPRARQRELAAEVSSDTAWISGSTVDAHALAHLWRPDTLAAVGMVLVAAPPLVAHGAVVLRELILERSLWLSQQLALPRIRPATDALDFLAGLPLEGDVVELDALLTRALLAAAGQASLDLGLLLQDPRLAAHWRPIEKSHSGPALRGDERPPPIATPNRVDPGAANPSREEEGRAPPRGAPGLGGSPNGTLERVGIELAHQMKNPLVTVKAFVQNVERLLERPDDFRNFAQLADESLCRMDAALNQLLAFARLAPRERGSIDVLAVLREALQAAAPQLLRKGIEVVEPKAGELAARVASDALRLAVDTVAAHVAETIEPYSTLYITTDVRPALQLSYRACGLPTHIEGILDGAEGGFPLPLLLVRGALEEQGGRLLIERDGADTRLSMEFEPG